MADITQIKLIDLVPPSIRDAPTIQAAAAAIDAELQAVTAAIPSTLLISKIDELPEDIIDHLAWQFHVDFYDPDLSLEQKRKLVKTSIDTHRHKGTPYVIEQVVAAILDDAEVQEWFNYGGDPYYFRVVKVGGNSFNEESYQRLIRAINTVKNTRSWIDKISISRTRSGNLHFGSMGSMGVKIKIKLLLEYQPCIDSVLHYGQAGHIASKITIHLNTFMLTIDSQSTYQGGAIHAAQKITIFVRPPTVTVDESLNYAGFAFSSGQKMLIKTQEV